MKKLFNKKVKKTKEKKKGKRYKKSSKLKTLLWLIIFLILILLIIYNFYYINKQNNLINTYNNEIKVLTNDKQELENLLQDKDNELSNKTNETEELQTQVNDLKSKVTSRSGANSSRSTTSSNYMKFEATGYCPCSICCGNSNGITASGTTATAGRTVAMSSNYNFGTKIEIQNMGTYIVEDRGGAIQGNKIDIFFNTHSEALNFGRRTVYLRVIK